MDKDFDSKPKITKVGAAPKDNKDGTKAKEGVR